MEREKLEVLFVEKPIHKRIKMYAAEKGITMQAVTEMLVKAGFDHIMAKEKPGGE